MDRQTLFTQVSNLFSAEPDYPWKKHPQHAVLRHPGKGKWFGVVVAIGGDKLGLPSTQIVDILNVKVRPEYLGSLRQQAGILPAYHMNKEHWVTVLLNGPLSDDEILDLLSDSFHLTA